MQVKMSIIDHAIITDSLEENAVELFLECGNPLLAFYAEHRLIPLELAYYINGETLCGDSLEL